MSLLRAPINLDSDATSNASHWGSSWWSPLGSRFQWSSTFFLAEVRHSFPYLVSINSVLPAIIAGNAVLLKPSPQTPLTAERFALALTRAGVPQDVIQVLHISPTLTNYVISRQSVDFVSFTGSVEGGRSVAKTAANAAGFTGVALEVSQFLDPKIRVSLKNSH